MTKFIMMVGLLEVVTYGQKFSSKRKCNNSFFRHFTTRVVGDENTQDNNEELFKELHRRIKQDLKGEQNVIYDATNISYKICKAFLEELEDKL